VAPSLMSMKVWLISHLAGESRIVLMPRDPQFTLTGMFPMSTKKTSGDKGNS